MHVGKHSVSELLALVGLRKCSKHRLNELTILILDIYNREMKVCLCVYTQNKLDIVQVLSCGEPNQPKPFPGALMKVQKEL